MRAQFCRRAQRYCCSYSLSKNEGLASMLYHLLIAPISASPPFPDQELFESTLWNSGIVKKTESLFPTNRMGDTESLLDSGGPHGVPLNFSHPLFWHSSILRGMGIGQEREYGLDREIHKLGREIQFLVGGPWFQMRRAWFTGGSTNNISVI